MWTLLLGAGIIAMTLPNSTACVPRRLHTACVQLVTGGKKVFSCWCNGVYLVRINELLLLWSMNTLWVVIFVNKWGSGRFGVARGVHARLCSAETQIRYFLTWIDRITLTVPGGMNLTDRTILLLVFIMLWDGNQLFCFLKNLLSENQVFCSL